MKTDAEYFNLLKMLAFQETERLSSLEVQSLIRFLKTYLHFETRFYWLQTKRVLHQ